MADSQTSLLKLLCAKPFQRDPRPKVTLAKLGKALERMEMSMSEQDLITTLQNAKGRGLANTLPKILMADEMATAEFQVWITPLGRQTLEQALAGE